MPYEDKNYDGSLVLDFRKRWRHVKTIYILQLLSGRRVATLVSCYCFVVVNNRYCFRAKGIVSVVCSIVHLYQAIHVRLYESCFKTGPLDKKSKKTGKTYIIQYHCIS